jgi:hypothetical protein
MCETKCPWCGEDLSLEYHNFESNNFDFGRYKAYKCYNCDYFTFTNKSRMRLIYKAKGMGLTITVP